MDLTSVNMSEQRVAGFEPIAQDATATDARVLSRSRVLEDGRKRFAVDLNKPLVFQVGHLGDACEEWVHQPIISNKGPRIFQSDVLEVVVYFVSVSARAGHTGYDLVSLVGLGLFIWTFMEYTLHRFLFHMKTRSYWPNTAHYLLHGCPHKHPMDSLRLVFPPAATAILCIPACNLVRLISTPTMTQALVGGVLLGYVMYDCIHYHLRHGQPSMGMPQELKKYHLNHHYRMQSKGFGITSSLWDILLGSLAAEKKR